jgi:tetratricopeptide (TPR) repeat protein
VNDLDFHAFQWLQYAYLQQGRYRAARALIDTARALIAGADLSLPAATDARFALPSLEFRYAIETGDWTVWSAAVKASEPVEAATDRARYFNRLTDYFTVMAAVLRGDTTSARALAPRVESGSGIMKAQLSALGAKARGDREDALRMLQEAAKLEESVLHSGPPNMVPSHELLGATQLEADRPTDAVQAYQKALDLMPKRNHALLGLARAQGAAGNRKAAAVTYQQLLANLHAADADLPMLAEARRGAR